MEILETKGQRPLGSTALVRNDWPVMQKRRGILSVDRPAKLDAREVTKVVQTAAVLRSCLRNREPVELADEAW